MANMFARLFRRAATPKPRPRSTDGRLIYAIGDIHGRCDLLEQLLHLIDEDARAAGIKPVIILLGDYVDRGPGSRQVLAKVADLLAEPSREVRALRGNHEDMLCAFLDDYRTGPSWLDVGGGETLRAFGLTPALRSDEEGWQKLRDALADAIGRKGHDMLRALEIIAIYGDYLFVHAGVRHDLPLDGQSVEDLLWIRHPAGSGDQPFEKMVVHGHTAAPAAFIGAHSVSVDTGAYATGVLSCARIMDDDICFIQTRRRNHAASDEVLRNYGT